MMFSSSSRIVATLTGSLLRHGARSDGGRWIMGHTLRYTSVTSCQRLSKPPEGEKEEGKATTKTERHPDAEKEPLPEWPDGVNPETGEKGGPKGPEPTRYGDWERKGRVSDF